VCEEEDRRRAGLVGLSSSCTSTGTNHLISWVKLARRSLHIHSLWKLGYLEYFRVKCYNGIFCALADYSVNVKKYQHKAREDCCGSTKDELTVNLLVL